MAQPVYVPELSSMVVMTPSAGATLLDGDGRAFWRPTKESLPITEEALLIGFFLG